MKIGATLDNSQYYTFKDVHGEKYSLSKLNKGDTVIMRISDSNPMVSEIVSWWPNKLDKDKYKIPVKILEKAKTEDTIYIGTICSMKKKKYSRNMKTVTRYYIQIEDSTFRSTYTELEGVDGKYIYNNVHKGEKVLYRKMNGKKVKVVNWKPSLDEIDKIKYNFQ